MSDNNIILVTNYKSIANIIKPKLVLLRAVDKILAVSYDDAVSTIESVSPKTILLYCSTVETGNCLNLIKQIKNNKKNKYIPIVLLLENLNQRFILRACEYGIDDYIKLKADNKAEMLIRTKWSLKKCELIKKSNKQIELLKKIKFIDKQTDFYTYDYGKDVYENEINFLKTISENSTMMLVRLAPESKEHVKQADFINAIKMSTRSTDTIIHYKKDQFYILLEGTQVEAVFILLDKIKKQLGKNVKIQASAINTENKDFDIINEKLLEGLHEVDVYCEDLVVFDENPDSKDEADKSVKPKISKKNNYYDEITPEDWISNLDARKKITKTKLESVITPCFRKIQTMYGLNIPDAEIEQKLTQEICEFILKTKKSKIIIRITYRRLSKFNIDCIYEDSKSSKNEKYNLDSTAFTEKMLNRTIIKFIEMYNEQAVKNKK